MSWKQNIEFVKETIHYLKNENDYLRKQLENPIIFHKQMVKHYSIGTINRLDDVDNLDDLSDDSSSDDSSLDDDESLDDDLIKPTKKKTTNTTIRYPYFINNGLNIVCCCGQKLTNNDGDRTTQTKYNRHKKTKFHKWFIIENNIKNDFTFSQISWEKP